MYSHNELIDYSIIMQGILSFCFLISAFSVASNNYGGFVAVFSAFCFMSFTGVSYYGVRYKPDKVFYGAILGGSVVLVFVTFLSAIFWREYSTCSTVSVPTAEPTSAPTYAPTSAPIGRSLSELVSLQLSNGTRESRPSRKLYGVECSQTSGMSALSFFSVLLMLTYMYFITVLFRFKDDILGSSRNNDRYFAVPNGNAADMKDEMDL